MSTITSLKFDIGSNWDGSGVAAARRDLDALSADLQRIEHTNVSAKVNVEIDETGMTAFMTRLDAFDGTTYSAKLTLEIDDSGLTALMTRLDAFDSSDYSARVSVNTGDAEAQIAALRAQLARLSDRTVNVRADTSSASANVNSFTKFMDKASKSTALLSTAALALGPALVPISVALLGIAGPAAALGTTVAVGVGIFGAAMKSAATAVVGTGSAVKKSHDALMKQQETLNTLTPGTKAYAAQAQKVTAAHTAMSNSLAVLTPTQRAFALSTIGLQSAWKGLVRDMSPQLLAPMTAVLEGAATAVDRLRPLIRALAPEALRLGEAIKKWEAGPGFQNFINLVRATAVPAVHNLVAAARSLAGVFGDFFRVFVGQGVGITKFLADGAAQLRKWADGGGFARFIDLVKSNAPQIKEFLSALGGALKTAGKAISDMGPGALTLSTLLLKIVAASPPSVIQAIAYAWIAWHAAMLLWSAIAPIVTTETFALAAAEVAAAWPIWLIVAAVLAIIVVLAALAFGIYELVTHWQTVINFFHGVWNTTFTAVWSALKLFAAWVTGVAAHIWEGLQIAWQATWNAIKLAAEIVWNALKLAFAKVAAAFVTAWQTTAAALTAAWNATWNALKTAGEAVWNAIKAAWTAVTTALRTAWNAFSAAMTTAWNAFWNALKSAAQAVWNAMQAAWNAFTSAMRNAYNAFSSALSSAWNAFWNAIKAAAQAVWNAMQSAWNAFMTAFRNAYNAFASALQTAWNALWNAIKAAAQAAFGALQTAVNTLWNGIKAAFSAGSSWLLNTFWNPVKNFLTNTIPAAFSAAVKAVGKAWDLIKKAVGTPVKIIVDVVYTNGLKKLWDPIAKIFGAPGLPAAPNIPSFATGGPIHGAGTGTSDSILANVSNGEHVWTADEVRGAGGHRAVASLRSAAMGGMPVRQQGEMNGRYAGRYATGGAVTPVNPGDVTVGGTPTGLGGDPTKTGQTIPGTGLVTSALDKLKGLVLGGVGVVVNPMLDALQALGIKAVDAAVPGSGNGMEKMGEGVVKLAIKTVKDWIKARDIAPTTGGNTAGAQKWADAQIGKPYSLGGNFGTTFDCSQFMSGITQIILGKPASPLFTTFAFDGSKQGPATFERDLKAPFMVGVTNAGVGHMAGTLNGTNYEATPPAVRKGTFARGYNDPMFPMQYGMKASQGLSGPIPAGAHLQIIDAALAAAGVPPPGTKQEWETGLNTLITRESNWNASAINNVDSNAAAGMPSQGLAQVIPPTFAAFHVAGTSSNILDPVANVAAAIKYIVATYGSITNVQQANASLPPKGYWNGTKSAASGWHMVGERGPEPVNFGGGGQSVRSFSDCIEDIKKAAHKSSGNSFTKEDWKAICDELKTSGTTITVPISVTGAGNPQEVCDRVEAELIPKLRMMLEQNVGRRR